MPTKTFWRGGKAQSILRLGALIISASLSLYLFLVYAKIISAPKEAVILTPSAVLVASALWLGVGVVIFLADSRKHTKLTMLGVFVSYCLLAIQTLCITGFASLFMPYWTLLLTATFILFGTIGMSTGVAALILTLVLDIFINIDNRFAYAVSAITTFIPVLISSVIISFFYSIQQAARRDLEGSRKREILERDRSLILINSITDAIFSIDKKGTVLTYNAAALNLIDTNEDIKGLKINNVIHAQSINKQPIQIFEELKKSSAIRRRDDVIMPLDSNNNIRLEITFAPVQGGSDQAPDAYILILRDITKSKSLEEERDEFISVVSHELRTPLTIAEGSLSNAKLLLERGAREKAPEALEESHRQVLFLSRMVNDLSTLSRAERGIADEAEIIDITKLARDLNNEYSPQAALKHLSFNLDIDGNVGYLKTSRLYLQELLQNLLTNAIKYTEKGSVTLAIKTQNDGFIEFSVKDTGIGISKPELTKIFDKFYRAEDYRTRETSGTGLGLYVASKLAKKLGCKIAVESRINHGSRFSFRLKLLEQSPEPDD